MSRGASGVGSEIETVVVTGGAGFIGSHTVDRLIEEGYRVFVIDNFVTGNRAFVHAEAQCIDEDITSPNVGELFARLRPQYIIHLAAQVSVAASAADPVDDVQKNVLGTVNVLEAARKNDVRKIVFASSAAVYGEPQTLPIDEDHPLVPSSVYGMSKWSAERYIQLYYALYELPYTILRYANVYGPRQGNSGEGGVVSIFTKQLIDGKQPTIFGTGEQTRDFIHVTDVAEANVSALKFAENAILNVSTEMPVSVNELFDQLITVSNRSIQPIYADPQPGDILHSCLANTLAKRLLNWEPRIPLYEGLTNTYKALLTDTGKQL